MRSNAQRHSNSLKLQTMIRGRRSASAVAVEAAMVLAAERVVDPVVVASRQPRAKEAATMTAANAHLARNVKKPAETTAPVSVPRDRNATRMTRNLANARRPHLPQRMMTSHRP